MNILGIDIGTTSVKIVVYNITNKAILKSIVKDTNSTLQLPNQYYHEQSVEKIFDTIINILHEFDSDDLKRVGHIGISGQMHGVLFWNNDKVDSTNIFEHSNLITWMDQRCKVNDFTDSLPKMPSYLVEELMVSTGYGCATMFHLNRFEKSFLDQWKYAGNIVDFFACQICDICRPIMSTHMAHGWGYFDLLHNCWFTDVLKENDFPVRFLPETNSPGTVFGKAKDFLPRISENAVVYVGMGDLQCSLYYGLQKNLNSAINMSTSSQFVVRVQLEDLKRLNNDRDGILHLPPGLVVNPFYNGDFLLVGASLNGGNVLANFVHVLQHWVSVISGIEISKDMVWSRLLSTYSNNTFGNGDGLSGDLLVVNPIIFGERYCPNAGAVVSNIFPYNCKLGDVYKAICKGLITNLTSLLPLKIISHLNVRQLTCSGGLISRHKCILDNIYETYGKSIPEIKFLSDYDACVGIVEYLSDII